MKEGMQMSDFEILSLMLMILGIIVSILIELIKAQKNNRFARENLAVIFHNF